MADFLINSAFFSPYFPLGMTIFLVIKVSNQGETMASSAKDIQLLELKDTITQLKTIISEQTELIRSLRLVIDAKTATKKPFRNRWIIYQKAFGSCQRKKNR